MINFKKFINMINEIKLQVATAKNSGKKITGVFGWTGSGKSSSINILMGSNLEFDHTGNLIVKAGDCEFSHIGHGDHSCTLYPELISNENSAYAFFDTAGVMDERAPGKETESSVAACSLPLLLKSTALHAVILVISKNFLDREGKASFSELFKSLGAFVNFDDALIKRKLFIIMTKTVDSTVIKALDKQISVLKEEDARSLNTIKNSIYLSTEEQIRQKIALRKTTLNLNSLIDERPRFGNVYIFHGTQNGDKEILLNKLTGCNVIKSTKRPHSKNIDEFALTAGAAYIRFNKRLYYINQFEGTCSFLDINLQTLNEFDTAMKMNLLPKSDGIRNLTDLELAKITSLTGHSHMQSVMQPLPQAAFRLDAIRATFENEFTNLRARVDAVVVPDLELMQNRTILQFKNALHDFIQAFNWLITQTIHLPNMDDLCANNIQKAVLELFAFYAQHDQRTFPEPLRILVNFMAELSPLIRKYCVEVEALCTFLDKMVANLNALLALPRLTPALEMPLQNPHMQAGLARIDGISGEHRNHFNHMIDGIPKADELYCHQLLEASATLDDEAYQQFKLAAVRTEGLRATLNTMATLAQDASDDALISMLADTLLTIKTTYTNPLAAISVTEYPLAYNLPFIHRAFQKLIQIEQDTTKKDADPHARILKGVTAGVSKLNDRMMAFTREAAPLLTMLLTDYYQSLRDIQTAQTNYISAYQRNCALNVNLMAGPVVYTASFQNRTIAAILNVPGGGTLNPFLGGRIDNNLLAAEALGLSNFAVEPNRRINTGVAELVLERKNFIDLLTARASDADKLPVYAEGNRECGSLPGKELLTDTNAVWERRVNLQIFNQDVYETRVYKNYEFFSVKASFWRNWSAQRGAQDGSSPSAPGNFLIDFGRYGLRRDAPFTVRVSTHGDGEVTYMYDQNHQHAQQTELLKDEIRRAITEYIDVQLTAVPGRVIAWAPQAITLSNLDSEVTLRNAPVIQIAQTNINAWFTNHRTTLSNSFQNHLAELQLPQDSTEHTDAQLQLSHRRIALLNLDIQVALIKLFAKLLGKNMRDPFFTGLVTAERIQTEIANMTNLAVTDPTPALTQALGATGITAADILALPDDYEERYLHPRTLLPRLMSKLALHTSWRTIRAGLPSLSSAQPNNEINLLIYLRALPVNVTRLDIEHRDVSAVHQACLIIAIRNHAQTLTQIKLRDIGLKNIGNLLQVCFAIQILDLSYNPLNENVFADLVLFLASNSALESLDLSANPSNDPIILDEECALNLLASLYLNRNLNSLLLDNIVFQQPIIARAITHLLSYKYNQAEKLDKLSEEAYFNLIDVELNKFLEAHPHPVLEFDQRGTLFNRDIINAPQLRDRIAKLKKEVAILPYNKNKTITKDVSSTHTKTAAQRTEGAKNQSQFFNFKTDLSQFNNDLLGRQVTIADGDCAFHAILGELNATKIYECKDIAAQRKKVADKIRECKPEDTIYTLVTSAIQEQVMSNRGSGKRIDEIKLEYKNHVEKNQAKIELTWSAFLKEVNQHPDVIKMINPSGTKLNENSKDKFINTLNKNKEKLEKLISAKPKLHEAYMAYGKTTNEGFDIGKRLEDRAAINEYATFIETPKQWLLPVELKLIAHTLDITVKFFNTNHEKKQILETGLYNPGKNKVVSVLFDGVNHYERYIPQPRLQKKKSTTETNKVAMRHS